MFPIRLTGSSLVVGLLVSLTSGASAYGPNNPPPPAPSIDDHDAPRFEGAGRALVGSIECVNDRERPAKVFVDGVFAAEVPAHARTIIPDVPNGVRLVSYRSGGRRHWQTDEVNVGIDRRAFVRIAALRGQALIHNRTGQVISVRLGTIEIGTAWPGADLETPVMPAGAYLLTATPYRIKAVPGSTQNIVIRGGETTEVEIEPFVATLVVRNPFPFRVALWVDTQRMGNIQEHAVERFATLQPGRARLELRKANAVLATAVVDLDAGREVAWDGGVQPTFEVRPPPIQAALGEVEFANTSGRRGAIRVELPGFAPFDLGRGESRVVQLPAGPMTATIVSPGGRRPMSFEVRASNRVQIPLRND